MGTGTGIVMGSGRSDVRWVMHPVEQGAGQSAPGTPVSTATGTAVGSADGCCALHGRDPKQGTAVNRLYTSFDKPSASL